MLQLLQRTAGNRAVTKLLGPDGDRSMAALARVATVQRSPSPAGKKVGPLQGTDVVLSRSPGNAVQKFVPWYRKEAGKKLKAWGFTLDPVAVRLADDKAVTVMALRWSTTWGTKPSTPWTGTEMRPIDAKAAQGAVHGLAGWAKVSAADQKIIDNLLGGELNNLSAAARDNLRPTFVTLASKSDTEQAKTLQGLLGSEDAMPDVVDEQMSVKAVDVKLTGPKVKKNYQFTGKKAPAESWTATFADGTSLEIIAPKAPTPGFHNHTVQQAADAARYVPKSNRALIKKIVLNAVVNPKDPHWAVKYKQPDFHSYMTAGVRGVVTIYPDKTGTDLPDENYMRGTMIHETGHTWAYKTWGTDTKKGKWLTWKKAMKADKLAVSDYAKKSITEDVSETIQVYGSTRGSARFNEYRAMVPQRFAILDKEMKKP